MKRIEKLVKSWQGEQEAVATLNNNREAELVRLLTSADRLREIQAKLQDAYTRVERVYQRLQDALRKRKEGQEEEEMEEEEEIPF